MSIKVRIYRQDTLVQCKGELWILVHAIFSGIKPWAYRHGWYYKPDGTVERHRLSGPGYILTNTLAAPFAKIGKQQ